MNFEVLNDLDLTHAAVGVYSEPIGDELMLANDLIEEEPSDHPAPGHGLPDLLLRCPPAHARGAVDFPHLLGRQLHRLMDKRVRNRKNQRPRLFHAHVPGGNALRSNGVDRHRRQPAHIETHARISGTGAKRNTTTRPATGISLPYRPDINRMVLISPQKVSSMRRLVRLVSRATTIPRISVLH